MKKIINMSLVTALITVFALSFNACSNDDDKDMTAPVISDQGITANPVNCQVYHRGDVIPFHYIMTDNEELGNYNIEIHNNFDHHSHGTSSVDCDEDDDHDHGEGEEHDHDHGEGEEHDHEHEEVEGAWVYNQDYAIARGLQCDTVDLQIVVPTDVLEGDYHFMLRLTDRAGWQTIKTVPIHLHEQGE